MAGIGGSHLLLLDYVITSREALAVIGGQLISTGLLALVPSARHTVGCDEEESWFLGFRGALLGCSSLA